MQTEDLQEFLESYEAFLLQNIHLLDGCSDELLTELQRFIVYVACKAHRDASRQALERLRRAEPC